MMSEPLQKVLYLPAQFQSLDKQGPASAATGNTPGGVITLVRKMSGKGNANGLSESRIDGDRLATDLSAATASLQEQGYRIVSVTPIVSGQYNVNDQVKNTKGAPVAHCYAYGFSYTEGLLIVAERLPIPRPEPPPVVSQD